MFIYNTDIILSPKSKSKYRRVYGHEKNATEIIDGALINIYTFYF